MYYCERDHITVLTVDKSYEIHLNLCACVHANASRFIQTLVLHARFAAVFLLICSLCRFGLVVFILEFYVVHTRLWRAYTTTAAMLTCIRAIHFSYDEWQTLKRLNLDRVPKMKRIAFVLPFKGNRMKKRREETEERLCAYVFTMRM